MTTQTDKRQTNGTSGHDANALLRTKYAPMLAKYRWFSLALYAVIAVAGSFLFFYTTSRSSHEIKTYELERLLNVERLRLESIVNKELAIILNMAASPIIQQFFGNPTDRELATIGRREIEAHRSQLSGSIFWVNDIDKMFHMNDLPPFYVDTELPENYWYNMTLWQTETYNFNINYNADINMTNLWINAPVYNADNVPIGLLGAGIDLQEFIESVYRQPAHRQRNNLAQRISLYFFNRGEEITGANDINLVSDKANIRDQVGRVGAYLIAAANALPENGFYVFDSPIGLVAVCHIPMLDWFAVGIMPQSFHDFLTPITIFFAIVLVLIAIILILSNIVIARLLQPLQETMLSLEAASRAKTNFLAKMSHEIRTPMNAIMGMSELALREEGMTPSAYNQIRTINQAGTNLISIINDILDLSKIESGKLEIINAPYQFQSLINDVITIINVRLNDSNVNFVVDIGDNIPCELIGDVVRIRQVLLNLLSNAAKYTKDGYVSLSITNEYTGEKSCVLTICVEDSGAGIKEEDLQKLFGEFIQVYDKEQKWTEGTGLGLAITKSLIAAMGGEIKVASVYGKGSTFTVTLPQTYENDEVVKFSSNSMAALGIASSASDEQSYYKSEKRNIIKQFSAPDAHVLVVDDNETNLMITEGLLGPYKVKVDLQDNGDGAIEAVQKNDYDIVFMDHMMPVKDGIETTKQIRELGGEKYLTLPIIALTANTVAGAKEMFIENGFNDFLSKPMDLAKLSALLEKWIPKEKQRFGFVNADSGKEEKELQIPNIDVQKGISMTGDFDNFMRAIMIFRDDTRKKTATIKAAYANADYKLYGIYVHALKSATANIGAAEISELAMKLESAAANQNEEFIVANHQKFMDNVEKLTNDIDDAIKLHSNEDNVGTGADLNKLKELLNDMKNALDTMNISAMDKTLEAMREFAKTAHVEKISESVFIGDYDSAMSLINVLSEELP